MHVVGGQARKFSLCTERSDGSPEFSRPFIELCKLERINFTGFELIFT